MRQFVGSISKNLKHFNPVRIFSFGGRGGLGKRTPKQNISMSEILTKINNISLNISHGWCKGTEKKEYEITVWLLGTRLNMLFDLNGLKFMKTRNCYEFPPFSYQNDNIRHPHS